MNSKQVLINNNNTYWSDYLKGCTQNDIVKYRHATEDNQAKKKGYAFSFN